MCAPCIHKADSTQAAFASKEGCLLAEARVEEQLFKDPLFVPFEFKAKCCGNVGCPFAYQSASGVCNMRKARLPKGSGGMLGKHGQHPDNTWRGWGAALHHGSLLSLLLHSTKRETGST